MKKRYIAIAAAVLPLMAHAEWFNFHAISQNDSNGLSQAVGESQFWMEIVETAPGHVSATFTNTGPYDSKISEIYFDTLDPYVDPPVDLQVQNIINGTGVKFSEDARPENIPGGQDPLIAFFADESVDSAGNHNTIDPGEYLTLEMTLSDPPYDFLDMLLAGDLRVALHGRALGEGFSESFINNTVPYQLTESGFAAIPEPSTILLMGFGVLGLLGIKKRLAI